MLFEHLHSLTGTRDGPEARLRRAPRGDYTHSRRGILARAGNPTGRTGGSGPRGEIRGLFDPARKPSAEFSACECAADHRAPRAPRHEVQCVAGADPTRAYGAPTGRHRATRWWRTKASAPSRLQPAG